MIENLEKHTKTNYTNDEKNVDLTNVELQYTNYQSLGCWSFTTAFLINM